MLALLFSPILIWAIAQMLWLTRHGLDMKRLEPAYKQARNASWWLVTSERARMSAEVQRRELDINDFSAQADANLDTISDWLDETREAYFVMPKLFLIPKFWKPVHTPEQIATFSTPVELPKLKQWPEFIGQ